MKHALLLVASAVLISGCNDTNSFAISPSPIDSCGKENRTITASWNVQSTQVKTVRVFIKAPAAEEKSWTEGGPQASKDTGPWVFDGVTFVFRDQDGNELARRTAKLQKCP